MRLVLGLSLLFCNLLVGAAADRSAWMKEARWGVMTHFLADWRAKTEDEPESVEHWNDLVDHFDVEGLAHQLQSVGAHYYLISIGLAECHVPLAGGTQLRQFRQRRPSGEF